MKLDLYLSCYDLVVIILTVNLTLLSRYNLLVSEAVEDLLPDYKTKEVPSKDALDVFIKHRQMATARAQEGAAPGLQQPAGKTLPPELMRRYEVYFKAPSAEKILPIREVKAQKIGKLVSIRGIITRATEVKPMMQVRLYFSKFCYSLSSPQVATYTCDQCGAETFQPVASTSFMPQVHCRPLQGSCT